MDFSIADPRTRKAAIYSKNEFQSVLVPQDRYAQSEDELIYEDKRTPAL
jgi:hypothetical protein